MVLPLAAPSGCSGGTARQECRRSRQISAQAQASSGPDRRTPGAEIPAERYVYGIIGEKIQEIEIARNDDSVSSGEGEHSFRASDPEGSVSAVTQMAGCADTKPP